MPHWLLAQKLTDILPPHTGPTVCWPLLPHCAPLHVFSPLQIHLGLALYTLLGLATMAAFLRQHVRPGWWLLLLLALGKIAILALDYRLRLNQHLMTAMLTFAFLLLPDRRRVLRYLLIAFYFWAGLLKLTPEWLNGTALYARHPLGIPDALLPLACQYVVVLEVVLVFGLLSRRPWLFWLTFAQLGLFHLASWPVVNFYYPLLMLTLLLIFPLDRQFPPLEIPRPRLQIATIALFSVLQLIPQLFPGDVQLTGEGRLWALHMFDVPLECQVVLTPHGPQGQPGRPRPLPVAGLSNRILCDPLVYASAVQDVCAHRPPQVRTLDLRLLSRRTGEPLFHLLVDAPDVCGQPLRYSLLRHNPWILSGNQRLPAQPGVPELRGR